jgi:hypothetical protein
VHIEGILSICPAPPLEEVLAISTIWPRFDVIESRLTTEDPRHCGRYVAEQQYVTLTILTPYQPKSPIVTLPIGLCAPISASADIADQVIPLHTGTLVKCDKDTGMWVPEPDFVGANHRPLLQLVYLSTILQASHLMPVRSSDPEHWEPRWHDHTKTLDTWQCYYINKFVDHNYEGPLDKIFKKTSANQSKQEQMKRTRVTGSEQE